MSNEAPQSNSPVVVTEAALRKIERRLKTRFRAFLRPGERVSLTVEDEEDFVYAQLTICPPDESTRMDLEAAMIAQDQRRMFVEQTTSRKRLLGAIEFLSGKLEEYFRSKRQKWFHVDWRLYEFDAATVRFRAHHRRPELEQKADELLEDDGEPQR